MIPPASATASSARPQRSGSRTRALVAVDMRSTIAAEPKRRL
jgi:hypothetical protein